MRTWPALDVGRLKPAPANGPDLLQAALVDYGVAAIDETTSDVWQVFFSTSAERDRAAENLTRQFPDLSIRPLDVPDEDWVAKSQADLRAVRIGNIIVAPPWDIPRTERLKSVKRNRSTSNSHTSDACPTPKPSRALLGGWGLVERQPLGVDSIGLGDAQPDQPIVIVIQPSMGFGTAHHATTRLCLAALQRLDVQGRSAIDIGTGSGVLAIAASRLGAAPVVGIDDDPDALQAAEDNLVLNGAADVTLRAADLRLTRPFGAAQGGPFDFAQGKPFDRAQGKPETFDLVMANLTGALLTEAAGRLRDLAAPGGRLILSGFMRHEEAAVLAASSDLIVTNRSEEDEWVCVDLLRA